MSLSFNLRGKQAPLNTSVHWFDSLELTLRVCVCVLGGVYVGVCVGASVCA